MFVPPKQIFLEILKIELSQQSSLSLQRKCASIVVCLVCSFLGVGGGEDVGLSQGFLSQWETTFLWSNVLEMQENCETRVELE